MTNCHDDIMSVTKGRCLSDKQFELLVELSSIHSKKVILALRDHLVLGKTRKEVCAQYGVGAGYLSLCIRRLLIVEKVVSRLAGFYQ
ncbi:transcriptional regulator [Escherichia coli]